MLSLACSRAVAIPSIKFHRVARYRTVTWSSHASSVHATEELWFMTLLQLNAWFGHETRGGDLRALESPVVR